MRSRQDLERESKLDRIVQEMAFSEGKDREKDCQPEEKRIKVVKSKAETGYL